MPRTNNKDLEFISNQFLSLSIHSRSLTMFPFKNYSDIDISYESNEIGSFLFSVKEDCLLSFYLNSEKPKPLIHLLSFEYFQKQIKSPSDFCRFYTFHDVMSEVSFWALQKYNMWFTNIATEEVKPTVLGMRELILLQSVTKI